MTLPSRLLALVVAATVVGAAARASADEPAPTRKVDDSARPSRKLAIGFGAGGAALLLTGVVLGAVAKSRSDEQNGNTGSPPLYTPALRARGQQGEGLAAGAYACFAIGGALAIADVVLWVERLRSHKPVEAHAATSPRRPIAPRAAVSIGPVGLSGTF